MTASSDYGIILERGTGIAPYTYAAIGQVKKIKPPAVEQELIEYTCHDSGGKRKRIPANLHDYKPFTVTVVHDAANAGQAALLAAVTSHAVEHLRITLPDSGAGAYVFDGWIKSYDTQEGDAQSPKALMDVITIQPDEVTFTP